MLYYALIFLSVAMFGGGFALQDVYRKKRGGGIKISMESAFIGGIAGFIVLLIINGFSFAFTAFTLIMAVWSAVNGIAFTFFTFKALDHINLSLFSLFSMLGGMVLPFFQGIFFYAEEMTIAKMVCIVFICLALGCTIKKGEKKKGLIFYLGIFILNGMAGAISKIFTTSEYPKVSAAGYSIWTCCFTIVLSGITLLLLFYTDKERNGNKVLSKQVLWQSYGIGALYGGVNKVANFLLVIALAHVDASVQYPIVTGGTMIVSTLLCCFGDKKPSKKEVTSVILAFIGMVALFLIPV